MDRGSFFEESETFRNKRGEAYRKLFVKYFVYNHLTYIPKQSSTDSFSYSDQTFLF